MSSSSPSVKNTTLAQVLRAFDCLDGYSVDDLRRATGGLINDTFLVRNDYVLQRLHPIFEGPVNDDISALGKVARRRGVQLPVVFDAKDGRRWSECDGVWRVLSYLPGRTLHQLENPRQAYSAGQLVGRFHSALADVEHRFSFSRGAFHDTAGRMDELAEALQVHGGHRLYGRVAPVGQGILEMWSGVGQPGELPQRICHGDLKVSNLRFSENGDDALSLLDLDTMTHGTLDAELGDAFRSWCNQALEHDPSPRWDLELFVQAWRGYTAEAGEHLTDGERASVVSGTLRIILELSARFAADALNETYFGFDPSVASTRGEHNLLRASSQLALARIVQDNRAVMESLVQG